MNENDNAVDGPDSEESPPKKKRISTAKIIRYVSIILIAFTAGYIHYRYVSHLFENDRNFSFLSEMEREMSLRTEMGFYYSYYKTIVQERPFMAGITKLMNDRLVEFPDEVNAFNRFNIHPEVLIGALYRYLEPALNTSAHRQCRAVERGAGLAPVQSCTGLGEPMLFYLEAVWLLAGLTVAALFLQATALSESILGGVVAVVHYFANHGECTRVQWAPNERENMAAPLLLLQLCLVTLQLRDRERRTTLQLQVSIFILNCLCLLFWQFSQFIFLSQLAIFFVMEQLRVIDLKTLCILLHSHFCGLHLAVLLLQGNDMLKSSLYTSFFIVLSVYCLFFSSLSVKIQSRADLLVESSLVVLRIAVVAGSSIYLKKVISDFLNVNEDSHIWDILRSKFTSYRSFHTLMYTCSDVFDFLPLATVTKLCSSLLLPLVLFSLTNVARVWFKTAKDQYHKATRESRTDRDSKHSARTDRDSSKSPKQTDKDNASDSDSGAATRKSRTHKEKHSERADRDSDKSPKQDKDSGSDSDSGIENPTADVDRVCIGGGCRVARQRPALGVEPAVFYNVAQLAAYGAMATLVMRLKLLLVPQMCVVSALLLNNNYYRLCGGVGGGVRGRVACALLVLGVLRALRINLAEELHHIGEFSDPAQEQLLSWILGEGSGCVFAGSLPLLASVLLVTRRAVLAHPHYEHYHARARAYAVYKAYGRFTARQVHEALRPLRASHLLLETSLCYGRTSKGCSFLDIWDAEVGRSAQPALCDTLLRGGPVDHLYPVYRNQHYAVFRIHDYSVRYMPRSFDT